jgi:FixJ family two-component response regulator
MSTRRKLVVVVDDDAGVLKGLRRLLTVYGFDTEVFTSAEAFLGRPAGRQEADCLVLDLHLPGTPGIELRRRLEASGCNIPVVFMTAFDDGSARDEAMKAGCIGCLQKPFRAHLLIDAVERAVSQSGRDPRRIPNP